MLKSEKYLGFDDRWLVVIGIPIISLVVMMMIFGTKGLMCQPITCIGITVLFTACYWMAFRWTLINYHRSYPNYKFTAKRLIYISSRLLFIYIIIKLLISLGINQIFPEQAQFYEANKVSPFISELSELLLITLVFFIYEGIYYFNKSRLIEIEKNQLQKITAEQRLDTLKNQVNPHFLFNSLNTLVTMIPEEPEAAIEFVQQLSKTYRNILELRDEKLITIQQEVKAMDSYIYLLKTRFQGKIHIFNHLDAQLNDQFILPLSLQILIENAVKHNVTSKKKPLKIGIYSEDGYICVQNNLQKKDQKYNSTKMGLANIKSRYRLLVDKEIIVKENSDSFTVKLPIIKNQEA